jgi:transcriptional regulator with XRE-family HTH domain
MSDDILAKLPQRFRELRVRAGLSQAALSQAVEMNTQSWASGVERGDYTPKYSTLWRVADVLSVRLSLPSNVIVGYIVAGLEMQESSK